jgi:hypothetical protein
MTRIVSCTISAEASGQRHFILLTKTVEVLCEHMVRRRARREKSLNVGGNIGTKDAYYFSSAEEPETRKHSVK